MENIWVECIRRKYRWNYKGWICVEDLFDLSLTDLDNIYRNLKKELEDLGGESLIIDKNTPIKMELDNKVNIVKEIFSIKQKELDERRKKIENLEEKQKIMKIIEGKQNKELEDKSIDELNELLDKLE